MSLRCGSRCRRGPRCQGTCTRGADQLVDGEGGVVGLDNGVGHLGRRDDGEGSIHGRGTLADLRWGGFPYAPVPPPRAAAELEALEAVAGLGLLADDVADGVDELGTLGVVTLGPAATAPVWPKTKLSGRKSWPKGPPARVRWHLVEVREDGAGHVATAGGLVVVDADPLQLRSESPW